MKKAAIFTLLILLACVVKAQTKIEISAPDNVGVGEKFRIVFSVNDVNGKFQPPVFDGSFSVSRPQTSTSQSAQWINGNVTSTSSTDYIYYIVPEKEGTFTIPPAKYVSKNKIVSSSSVTITVSKSSSSASSSRTSSGGYSSSSQQPATESGGDAVYLRLLTNNNSVYVGQPVEATLKLFTRIQISSLGNGIGYPDFKGFLKEDIKVPPLQSLNMENINGRQYGTGTIDKFLLYPQIAGDLKIDRAQMQVLVKQKSDFDDLFGDSFLSSVMTVPRNISSQPVTIHVKPLPTPQPSDFYGAVGKFEIKSSLSKESVQANDALTYTITLSGTGNINTAGNPVFETPSTVEKYDPKVTVNAQGMNGTKTFEYIIIPRHSGEFVIPEVNYSFFDTNTGRYVTLKTQPYRVKVTPGSGSSEAAGPALSSSKEDVKYVGQDIRFIKTDNNRLRMKSAPVVESFSYVLLYIFVLVIAVVFFVVLRQFKHRREDVNLSRNRKAAMVAKRRLKNAEERLKEKSYDQMHDELAKALWGYMSDKLLIPLSDLTRDNCISMLKEKKVPDDTVNEFDSILSLCEYSRYAPASGAESPEMVYKRSENLISTLENLL